MRVKMIAIMLLAAVQITAQPYPARNGKTVFEIRNAVDRNGYRYQTVSNDPAGVRTYTLKNGLTVHLAQDFSRPSVMYATALRAGSAYDPKDNTGLAHYLEHLLFNGTSSIGALNWEKEKPLLKRIEDLYEIHKKETDPEKKKAIYKTIDSISYEASKYAIKGEYRKVLGNIGGVGINGTTNFEYIIYGCMVPALSLDKLLQIEKERFLNPAFRAFHTELEIVYEEFNSMQDNDFIQKYFPANQALFAKHPYGQQTVIGSSEHLKNPSIKAIREYFNKYYVPGNMAVILIGDLDFEKTIQMVDRSFGTLPAKDFKRPDFPKEDEMKEPVELSLSSPQQAATFIAHRFAGAGSRDAMMLALVDKMLSNSVAGLLRTELVAKQKIRNVFTLLVENKDYSMYYINANPVPGQSLQDVRKEVFSLIDKLKKGEFDEWMIKASARDLKRDFIRDITEHQNLDGQLAYNFTRFQSWQQTLQKYEDMLRVTRQELMDWMDSAFRNNYVVVYKSEGPSTNLVKVEKPQINPIQLNEQKESAWAREFEKEKVPPTKPEFLNKSQVRYVTLKNGVQVQHVPNTRNDLFQLDMVFEMGKNTDKMVQLAANYINFTGTSRFSATDWKKEFYKLGLSFTVRAQNTQTVFHLEGLQENIEPGLRLAYHLMDSLVADNDIYQQYVQSMLNNRKANRNNRSSIRQALYTFALYGENSAYRDIYSENELKQINPATLVEKLKQLRTYQHRIFYFGKMGSSLQSLLDRYNPASAPLKPVPPSKSYLVQQAKPVVYFAHYEGAQAEVVVLTRGGQFNKKALALSNMFNRFIEKVVFHEIREARSLVYNVWGVHTMPSDTLNYDYMEIYSGTQSNKLPEVLKVSTSLLKSIDTFTNVFAAAKTDQLIRYQRERIQGIDILWTLDSWRKLGINKDFREDMYHAIQQMSFEDVKQFFAQHIASSDIVIVVVGDKKDIDMSELKKYGQVREMEIDYLFNY
ncbi:MAG TPA: insulinase family protein [Chitinophagaceae bacterium]|nr:insulinase family protein [Chitinophagaceae bacterium]